MHRSFYELHDVYDYSTAVYILVIQSSMIRFKTISSWSHYFTTTNTFIFNFMALYCKTKQTNSCSTILAECPNFLWLISFNASGLF